mgnify:CR=1 FL=1
MAFLPPGAGAPDYFPCHYGTSRLTFRGPKRDLTGEYLAVLGGTESYGRDVSMPFSAVLEADLGIPIANLACQNAGPDVYLADRPTLEVAAEAHLVIVQLTGVQNVSNRYYTVHPRRNDRFVAASPLLRSLYREVDFTEFHFTRHLLRSLAARGKDRFAPIAAELKALWLQRMTAILDRLPRRRVLLWLSDRPPQTPGEGGDLAGASWLVDRAMIDQLLPLAPAYVECIPASPDPVGSRPPPPAAALPIGSETWLPDTETHARAAGALRPVVEKLL